VGQNERMNERMKELQYHDVSTYLHAWYKTKTKGFPHRTRCLVSDFCVASESMAAAPPLDGQQQLEFIDVVNERLLIPNHREMPIYVPYLKTTLTTGHFILVRKSGGDPLIGQVLCRSNRPNYPQHFIKVCCFFPLFSEEIFQHINNPVILP
jgi:hypothetical protein